ncbi:thermonuclease family protein [Candidatus Microgenomates bacterium]|nr:thermonuclease family protein [Candidatus Microgenomates bacterium]
MPKYFGIILILILSLLGFSLLVKDRGGKQASSRSGKEARIISPTPTLTPTKSSSFSLSAQRQKAQVARVIDGDTIELSDGNRVRYIGIDTPETVDPRKSIQCFGREASNKNNELVLGKDVELEKDISETDKYGRLLRYIYIDDLFINDYLVRQGFAHASSYPPDIKYQDQLRQAEQEARENGRGLWSACGGGGKTETIGECQIKGNISSSGEKIYHLPSCPYWSKTVISEEKGERWFCSEDEALTAGWRRAQNCP